MRHRRRGLLRGIVAFVSVLAAWWLFDIAGNWSHGPRPFAQFLCFFFCAIAIERIFGAAVDLAVIAWGAGAPRAPRDRRS